MFIVKARSGALKVAHREQLIQSSRARQFKVTPFYLKRLTFYITPPRMAIPRLEWIPRPYKGGGQEWVGAKTGL